MLNEQCKNYAYLHMVLCIILVVQTEPYGNINQVAEAHIKLNKNVHNISSNIPTEGGSINITTKRQENTLTKPLTSNISTEASTSTTIKEHSNLINHGREGVNMTIKHENISQAINATTHKTINGTSTTEKIIPVKEVEVITPTLKPPTIPTLNVTKKHNLSSTTETPIEFTGDSKIKPRKGAPTYLLETTKVTTPKPKKLKPTVTDASDDEPYPPSNFVPHTNSKKELNNSSDLKSKQQGGYLGNKYFKKGPDFVLPIVLTILAVPLLAILLTVLYKRGSEWWQHRHYRRMDFLIDGMYNN